MAADLPTPNRREFLGALPVALSASSVFGAGSSPIDSFREWLRPHVVQPDTLELFLDPTAKVWARFDPTFGYLLRNA
ncbi:MAG: hypothetical protein ACK54R_03340, partial [Pirellulaceae bacterium]